MFFILLSLIFSEEIEVLTRYQKDQISKPVKTRTRFANRNREEPEIPYWQDINAVAINKEKPRASFISYDDTKTALTYEFENSPYYINLNGKWKFYYVDYPKDLPPNITNADVDPSSWHDINVPGSWEPQGFAIAMYTNIKYDFNPKNPSPPKLPDYVPTGVYRRNMDIPESWLSRDIYLQIGGAKTGLYVYVNGIEVGYSEDSKNPADFLINDYVHSGSNIVTFKLYKHSSGSYLDDQDMWRLGGIERDVILYSQPKTHIQDFDIVSTLDDAYVDGLLKIKMKVQNDEAKSQDVKIDYDLYDSDNTTIVAHDSFSTTVGSHEISKFTYANMTIKNVKKWSAEHPNLYMVVFTLSTKAGKVLEIVPFRIGFRRTEFSTRVFEGKTYPILLFNGKEVLYKGVNIHEHDPKTGHYVTDEIRFKDIELLKKHNFNALRFSHYPNARRFFEICDQYGIYVCVECNLESHGMGYNRNKGGTLANNPDWFIPHMDRTKNTYLRCRNYACVTFISLGNEAGNGYNFYETYEYVKNRELRGQNRPVQYGIAAWEFNTDLFVQTYLTAKDLLDYGTKGTDRPIIISEYNHAMGNSNGNFKLMWDYMYKYPNLQGGFIWDWVDQGLLEIGKGGRIYYSYGGDYGENAPSDGNFNINGLLNPDRDPHPAIQEVKYVQQNVNFTIIDLEKGKFGITNRFFFTDLADYEISYSILQNEKVLQTKVIDINLQPQEEKEVTVEYGQLTPDVQTEYFINFKVVTNKDLPNLPKGYEVAHEQFKLPVDVLPRLTPTVTGNQLKVAVKNNYLVISNEKVSFAFNITSGIVDSYKVDNKEYFQDSFGFRPNFWRSPTDNDYGNGEPARQQVWKTASHSFNLDYKTEEDTANKLVKLTINYKLVSNITYSIVYKIFYNGVVRVNCDYIGKYRSSDQQDLPRIGFRFRVPPTMNQVEYFGRGPEENYWDRHYGAQVGRYSDTAENMYYPYVRPQENGHHTQVRWLALESDSMNLLFTANNNSELNNYIEFNALRNSIEDFDDEDQTDLPRQWDNFDDCFHTGLPPHHDEQSAKNKLRRQHHIDDIVPQNFVEVNIDFKMMGLAGFNSWGDKPLPEHTMPSNGNYSFSFTIIPIESKNEIDEQIRYLY